MRAFAAPQHRRAAAVWGGHSLRRPPFLRAFLRLCGRRILRRYFEACVLLGARFSGFVRRQPRELFRPTCACLNVPGAPFCAEDFFMGHRGFLWRAAGIEIWRQRFCFAGAPRFAAAGGAGKVKASGARGAQMRR